jgi:AcrR family transcriptional regulator
MSNRKKRSYRSETRHAQAEQTRQRILQAARKLFAKRGFDSVTIDELADEAGVSSPTIFLLYKSKKGLLRALLNEIRFGHRYESLVQTALAFDNPIERLKMAASISRAVFDSGRSEMWLIRGASAFSPDLKELEREGDQLRFERQEETIKLLFKAKLLAKGLDIARARDILWTLTSWEIYRMLVIERGWTSDHYEKWLANVLVNTLVRV